MNDIYEIIHYEENGRNFYQEWLDSLRDAQGRDAVKRTQQKDISHAVEYLRKYKKEA